MLQNINYETENLCLIPYKQEDLEEIYKLFLDEKLMLFIPDEVPSKEQVARLISKMVDYYYPETEKGNICLFTLSAKLKATGEIIGWCGVNDFDLVEGKSEVFCALSSDHWGKGYGTELVEALFHIVFEMLELKEISAAVHPQNTASLKIVKKYAHCLGTIEEVFGLEDEKELYFVISKDNYREGKQ